MADPGAKKNAIPPEPRDGVEGNSLRSTTAAKHTATPASPPSLEDFQAEVNAGLDELDADKAREKLDRAKLLWGADTKKLRDIPPCDRNVFLAEWDRVLGRKPIVRPRLEHAAILFRRMTKARSKRIREKVPQELQDLPNWVCADRTLDAKKRKSSKAPLNAKTGRYARSNDPSTWVTIEEAIAFALSDAGYRVCTIGVNLRGTDFVGLDLDGVIDANGEINAKAQKLMRDLPRGYWEKSPSGRGLRAFYQGTSPVTWPEQDDVFGPGTKIEVYDGSTGGRYLTVTGEVL